METVSQSSNILKNKWKALSLFRQRLLSSAEGKYIGKIILFGSLNRCEAKADSDVDVLILALDNLKEVENAADGVAFDIGLETGVSVEPLVYYCFDEWRHHPSYFFYHISQNGAEIYSMDETEIRKEESRGYRDLALEHLDGASDSLKNGHARLAVDAAFNAAVLCAKGLLLLKMDSLPTSHGGVVVQFSKKYLKEGMVPRDMAGI